MPKVSFKAKVENIYNVDDSVAYQRVKVPTLDRRHCDMEAFRRHAKYGSYANSDLFPNLLRRALKNAAIGDYIRLDRVPTCVTVDTSGFLADVIIEL